MKKEKKGNMKGNEIALRPSYWASVMGGKVYTIPEYGENGAYVGADIEVEPSWVECQNCHATGQTFDESDEDPEKAIEAWNRRADDGKVH